MKLGVTKIGVVSAAFASLIAAGAFLAGTSDAGAPIDTDSDGVFDFQDNCSTVPNASQLDTNSDGYGNACDADLNNDGAVGAPDLGTFKTAFGAVGPNDADFNGDNAVGAPDLGTFKTAFGGAPGPSGHSCAGTVPCPN